MHDKTMNSKRRQLIKAAGASALASPFAAAFAETRALRWGIVGTGMIANNMASSIKTATLAKLAAVSSRRIESANEFAAKHGIPAAYASWEEMIASDDVDAIYVATPTFVREEICVAAASNGKHVLGEKPFANLPSLKRITAACRNNNVGFMDGTHFVHHPRNQHIRDTLQSKIGTPWSIASAFHFRISDAKNIRLNPEYEPYGAIGDAGWYNMRAAVEFTPDSIQVAGAEAFARRGVNNAIVTAGGIVGFEDGSTTTFSCGFEAGAGNMDLRLTGERGDFNMNDFILPQGDGSAGYNFRNGWINSESERIEIKSSKSASVLMFEDFAAMVNDAAKFEASVTASERTQQLLDLVWERAQ